MSIAACSMGSAGASWLPAFSTHATQLQRGSAMQTSSSAHQSTASHTGSPACRWAHAMLVVTACCTHELLHRPPQHWRSSVCTPVHLCHQVKALKEGKPIDKPIYNHVTGLLDAPETIDAPKVRLGGLGDDQLTYCARALCSLLRIQQLQRMTSRVSGSYMLS